MYGLSMATTQTCPFGSDDSRVASLLPSDRFDFTNPDILEKGIPVTEFAELRKTAPVWWNEQPESYAETGGKVLQRHGRRSGERNHDHP